jgi:signal transduction histidine kinase/ligand-binding sensor domain-containing protein
MPVFARRSPVTLIIVGLLLLADSSSAADPSSVFTDYSVASWGVNEGAPDGAVYALAQDHAGYLWLGTEAGLYRFDGTRFVSSTPMGTPAGAPVQALHVSRDGSLWVGFGGRGGVSRLRGTEPRNYAAADGIPSLAVNTIVEDAAGMIWVGSEAGLFFLDGDRWKKWPAASDLPNVAVWGAHVDRRGDLFVTTAGGVFRRARQAERFEAVARFGATSVAAVPDRGPFFEGPGDNGPWTPRLPSDEVVRSLATDVEGRLVASDWRFGFRRLDGMRQVATGHRGRGLQIMIDRGSHLWVATVGQGVWRVSEAKNADGGVERITARTGLAAEGAFSLLEDKEGNIWVGGTPSGVTRLTPNKFLPFIRDGVVTTLAVTPGGHAWVGTSDALIEMTAPDRRPPAERHFLSGVPIRALHTDASGTLWVATPEKLLRIPAGQPTASVVRNSETLHEIDTITSPLRGGLFLADRSQGLLHWTESKGFEPVQLPSAVQGVRVVTVYADRRERLWIVFATGAVAMLTGDERAELFTRAQGFDAGAYRIVHEDNRGVIWFGATNGITSYENGRVSTVHGSDRVPIRRVRAIAHDDDGYLWIATGNGILRIHPADVDQVASTESFWPAYILYDKSDGLAGQPRLLSDSTSIRMPNGALWFVTAEGITIVDPKAPGVDTGVPIVSIDRAVVDDGETAAIPDFEMPAGTRRIQFDYSALNLTTPQKTRYRFMLEGVDTEWIDAGTRRQASYTNLAPGAYRFRVAATSAHGEWPESPTVWTFSIKPHFYQTRWFSALCAALVILAACAAWTMRLRQERKRFSVLLAERVRLSREIHDTLLQGLVGVALQCDALATHMQTAAPEISERFVRLRKQAQRYIKESRQAIWNLRSSPPEDDLVAALRRVGDETAGTGSEFAFELAGQPRELGIDVEQQLVRIAHEAVANAVRHARAQRIEVGLDYQADHLVLRVSDDGCGFVDHGQGGTDGHFGIVSMRERADGIDASFALDSAPGRGTRIAVILPTANGSKPARR